MNEEECWGGGRGRNQVYNGMVGGVGEGQTSGGT